MMADNGTCGLQEVLLLIHLRDCTCYEVLNTHNEQKEPNKSWPSRDSFLWKQDCTRKLTEL